MQVAILEDVVTTGGSALKAIARVREHGLVVAIVLGLVDREEGGREVLEKEAPLVTLFRRRDFLDDGREAGAAGRRRSGRSRLLAARVRLRGAGCATQKPVRRRLLRDPARLPRQGLRARLRALDAPRLGRPRTTRRRARGLGHLQELGLSRGVHRALRRDLQPVGRRREDAARGPARGVHGGLRVPRHGAGANYKWNDFEKASSSAWRATLVDALGHELAPEHVRVEKLPDAYEHEFFPSKTPFTKTYAIRFVVPATRRRLRGHEVGRDHAALREPDRPRRSRVASS